MIHPDTSWPRELPMFPLGSVSFPGVGVPLHVFEPRYRALVMTCLTSDRLFGSTLIERGSEVGGGDQRARTGCLLRIVDAEEQPDGRWAVLALGIERLRVVEWLPDDPFPRCIAERSPDGPSDGSSRELVHKVLDRLMLAARRTSSDREISLDLPELDSDPSVASFQLASISPLGPLDRLKALELSDPTSRLVFLLDSVDAHLEIIEALESLGSPNDPDGGSDPD